MISLSGGAVPRQSLALSRERGVAVRTSQLRGAGMGARPAARSGYRLTLAVALLYAALPSASFGQTTSPPPPPLPKPSPPTQGPPPFPAARGGNGPVQIPINGLSAGTSRIAAGLQQFSLCWQGGEPPFALGVQLAGKQLVGVTDFSARQFTNRPGLLDIEPGNYDIQLGDSTGAQTSGRFTAVPPSQIPGANQPAATKGDALAQANTLLAYGGAFDYEAYLRLMALSPRMRRCSARWTASATECPATLPARSGAWTWWRGADPVERAQYRG